MTEAELIQSATAHFEIGVATLAIYMTISSGYLIVAYAVGSKLTSSQVIIISTLFCFIAAIATYAFGEWMNRAARYLVHMVSSGKSSIDIQLLPSLPLLLAFVMAMGIFACLKFMWDVRHPKD